MPGVLNAATEKLTRTYHYRETMLTTCYLLFIDVLETFCKLLTSNPVFGLDMPSKDPMSSDNHRALPKLALDVGGPIFLRLVTTEPGKMAFELWLVARHATNWGLGFRV